MLKTDFKVQQSQHMRAVVSAKQTLGATQGHRPRIAISRGSVCVLLCLRRTSHPQRSRLR